MMLPGNVPEELVSSLGRLSLNPLDHCTSETAHDGLSPPPNAGLLNEDLPPTRSLLKLSLCADKEAPAGGSYQLVSQLLVRKL